MTSTTRNRPPDPLLPDALLDIATHQGIPIVVPDYPISMKKRVHIAYDPVADDYLTTLSIDEAFGLLTDREFTQCLLVSPEPREHRRIIGTVHFQEHP